MIISMIERIYTFVGLIEKTYIWFIGVASLVFLVLSMIGVREELLVNILALYISLLFFVVIPYLLIANHRKNKQIKLRPSLMNNIASNDNYSYEDTPSVDIRSDNLTHLMNWDVTLSNGLVGKDWGYQEIKYYESKKSHRISAVYYSILRVDLGRNLPHIFFDNHKAHGRQFRWQIDTGQVSSLEGDFDKYFTTYFPEGYHIDARSIISPEVMAAIIDASPCDVEINKDKLYLFSALIPTNKVKNFIESGIDIRSSLMDHSKYYIDELDTKGRHSKISAYGASLNKRSTELLASAVILFVIAIALLLKINFNNNLWELLKVLFGSIILFCGSIWMLYDWNRERLAVKTKRQKLEAAVYERDGKYL